MIGIKHLIIEATGASDKEMGKRRRGGRRAAPQRRAGDLFDVAFVVEELVRDVEALWEAWAGVNHDDDDRCDRHAFCARCAGECSRTLFLA